MQIKAMRYHRYHFTSTRMANDNNRYQVLAGMRSN